MRNLLFVLVFISITVLGCAGNKSPLENNEKYNEKFIYIQKQSEFDIWYYAYPDNYYGDLGVSNFWIRYQIRSHQKCIKYIQLHFFLIYDEKTYPLSFSQTCPVSASAITGDMGFPIPEYIQDIIKDNSRLDTRFSHVDYLN